MRALKKSALREIRGSLGRYLAILAIVALGVGFFCGLRICKTAMVSSADHTIQTYNLYDYRLISTLGFTGEDVSSFAAMDGVLSAEGAVYEDVLFTDSDGAGRVLRIHSLTRQLNLPALTAGRLPENDSELVLDARAFDESALGTRIALSDENDADTLDKFAHRSYTVVGLVNSVYYLNYERGNTSLGSGGIYAFALLPYSGFNVDYYSEIFVDLATTGEIYSDEYNAGLTAFEESLSDLSQSRADLRYRKLVDDAQTEIADAQSELDDKTREYEEEKSSAEDELGEARQKLSDARQEIDDGELELIENRDKLSSAEAQYNAGLSSYRKSKSEFESKKKAALAELDAAQSEIDANRAQTEAGLTAIAESGVLDSYAQLTAGLEAVQDGLDTLEAQRSETLAEPTAARDALSDALNEARAAVQSLKDARDGAVGDLNAQISDLEAQISGWNSEIDALDGEDPDQAAQIDVLRGRISDAQGGISGLKDSISAAESDYAAQIEAAQAQADALSAQLAGLEAQLQKINAGFDAQRTPLEEQAAALQASIDAIEQSGTLTQYQSLLDAQTQLDAAQATLDAQRASANAEFKKAQDKLDAAKSKLNSYRKQIASGKTQLKDGQSTLEDARTELEDGRREYGDARSEAQEEFAKAAQEITSAQKEIDDAQTQVNAIEPATLYALSRKTNIGYACFESDSQIVQGISTVFPLFFFLVAALVCMTTMTRMVDEQRTVIGTLKALGYSKAAILSKYLFYSGSAATLGTLIGYLGGSYIFPKVIWMAYGIMYNFGEIDYVLSPVMGMASYAAALLCSMGATWLSCNVELSNVPAQLIRPKAPKAGKRILLERVRFIWKRLSFLKKVSIRNILRSKKRLMMMIIGISGCTALLVTGFGINDSIANLANDQYDKITVYDCGVSFAEDLSEKSMQDFLDGAGSAVDGCLFLYQGSIDVASGDTTKSVYMMVTDADDISPFVAMHSGDAPVSLPGFGECVISRGLAERFGFSVGESITAYDEDMNRLQLTLSGIFDNYVYDYLYVRPDSIAAQWGEAPAFQTAFVNCAEGHDAGDVSALLSGLDNVNAVSSGADTRVRFVNMMSSLNYIVLLIIVCAGSLAFIVLYNLTNINITERLREIATVKVLGFTLRETASYVLSENVVLSALGALAGLPLGKLLHAFVMSQIKVDQVVFDVRIADISYVWSILLTMAFALLVNAAMLKKIDRINMAESLKTIE